MNPDDFLPKQALVDTETPWSDKQLDIFAAIDLERDNLIVEAVAGSGKTTTILQGVNRTMVSDPAQEILMLAFNKAIAMELQSRVPYGVEAKTFHALGLSTFQGKRPKVKGYKLRGILKDIIPSRYYEECVRDILRMVSLIKANAILTPDLEEWYAALGDFDINCEEKMEAKYVKWASEAFILSCKDTTTIDFDDMIFFPILFDYPFNQYDMVVVDEAQDLSPIQHEIVLRLLKPGGRVVAVGDTHQAIYGFRGADHNSMNRFRHQFHTRELPLSISYRCPSSVVAEAQRYVPHIEAAPLAALGRVDWFDHMPQPVTSLQKDDLIICRNNAPLFRLAMKFIRERHPVTVKGNFGAMLIGFIKGFKTKDINVFFHALEKWYDAEYKRLVENEQMTKAYMVQDKYESLKAVAEVSSSVDEMIDILTDLFKPGRGATLSSIHRAKGTEAKNVHFYIPGLLPSKFANSSSALQQEDNLSYVGITRSLNTLNFIHEEN
jgi:superfamily I DNA/RNA helicase